LFILFILANQIGVMINARAKFPSQSFLLAQVSQNYKEVSDPSIIVQFKCGP
jgi:hypothetical protein